MMTNNDKIGVLVVWTDLDWTLLGFFWTTGTGWSSWNASASGTESSASSKKSNGSLRIERGGLRSGAKSEGLDEKVSDRTQTLVGQQLYFFFHFGQS